MEQEQAPSLGEQTLIRFQQKQASTEVSSECASFGADSVVECSVYNELKESNQAVNTKVTKIECGPGKTTKIGERVYVRLNMSLRGLLAVVQHQLSSLVKTE